VAKAKGYAARGVPSYRPLVSSIQNKPSATTFVQLLTRRGAQETATEAGTAKLRAQIETQLGPRTAGDGQELVRAVGAARALCPRPPIWRMRGATLRAMLLAEELPARLRP
jgi:hypothetical protein